MGKIVIKCDHNSKPILMDIDEYIFYIKRIKKINKINNKNMDFASLYPTTMRDLNDDLLNQINRRKKLNKILNNIK